MEEKLQKLEEARTNSSKGGDAKQTGTSSSGQHLLLHVRNEPAESGQYSNFATRLVKGEVNIQMRAKTRGASRSSFAVVCAAARSIIRSSIFYPVFAHVHDLQL